MHKLTKAALPLMVSAVIWGCSSDNESLETVVGDVGDQSGAAGTPATVVRPVARFQPSQAVLPFPSDLLFSGTKDGSLNIPLKDASGQALFNYNQATAPTAADIAAAGANAPRVAMNTMDGFSTTAPVTFSLSAPVDTTNIENGTAVRLFKVNTTPGVFDSGQCVFANTCTGFDAASKTTWSLEPGSSELIYGVDYVASAAPDGAGGMSVLVLPLKPFAPSSTYMVMVTDAMPLASDSGINIHADLEYEIAKATKPLFFLKRDLATELGTAQIAGIEAALGLSAGDATHVFTPPTAPLFTDLNAADSCVFVKGIADKIDALNALPSAIAFNPITDCMASLSTLAADPASAFTFESLRIQTSAHEAALATYTAANPNPAATALLPVTNDNMVLTFSFSTQNIGSALINAKGQVAMTSPGINIHNEISEWAANTNLALKSPGADGDITTPGDALANVFLGTLENIAQFVDPADKNGSFWKASPDTWAKPTIVGPVASAACVDAFDDLSLNNGSENLLPCNGFTPAMTSAAPSHDIPVIISTPDIAKVDAVNGNTNCADLNAASGIPVVIYQHGITTHRGTVMALADSMAKACVAVVAIDLPKHGIQPSDPLGMSALVGAYQNFQLLDGVAAADITPERLVAVAAAADCLNEAGAQASDTGFVCGSGDRFINLENLPNSRDSLRQGVVDLHSLYRALTTTSTPTAADVGVALDTNNVHFVGMSLGGLVGSPFVAQEPGIKTVTLNVSSGGIAKILDGSPSFEPVVTAGLAAAGVVKPSANYEAFLIAAQTMVDSADAMNMTAQIATAEGSPTFWAGLTPAAGSARPVLFQQIIGTAANLGDSACNTDVNSPAVDNSGCPDMTVPNNVYGGSTSLATAWGAVSGTGQTGFLPGQNPVTVPSALSGTDALTQGTAFVALAANSVIGNPVSTALGSVPVFYGMNLSTVDSAGTGNGTADVSGLVRFTAGEHGSLLNPDPGGDGINDPAYFTTAAMQTQLATYVATGGRMIVGTGTPIPFSATAATNTLLGSVIAD